MTPTSKDKKITTLNLDGKKGVPILISRYDMMRASIIKVLKNNGQTTLSDLNLLVTKDLNKNFDGSIGWYLMAIKLDLEARDIITRVPKKSPQSLTIK